LQVSGFLESLTPGFADGWRTAHRNASSYQLAFRTRVAPAVEKVSGLLSGSIVTKRAEEDPQAVRSAMNRIAQRVTLYLRQVVNGHYIAAGNLQPPSSYGTITYATIRRSAAFPMK
jgi:hypothetical protein